jgi:hypothetical protein
MGKKIAKASLVNAGVQAIPVFLAHASESRNFFDTYLSK